MLWASIASAAWWASAGPPPRAPSATKSSTPTTAAAAGRKGLAGGYTHVAVVSPDARRLKKLRAAIEGQLTEAERARVGFYAPDELFAFVQDLEIGQAQKQRKVRGYTVKTSFKAVGSEEGKERRQAISQVVAKAMTRLQQRARKK